MKLLILLLLVAVPSQVLAAPCPEAVVLRDGKLFAAGEAEEPDFDPKVAPTIPWCDGDVLPPNDLRDLMKTEDGLEVAGAKIKFLEDSLLRNERACAERIAIQRNARLEAERERVPAPAKVAWYARPLAVATITTVLVLAIGGMAIYATR